ncbi:MAG: hypothetical protein KIT58_10780 [Planctomycetota bacterium]|nr:hypothetical protein [Planctomycetota bacterium]
MTPRAVLVRAAARGLVLGVPPAVLAGYVAHLEMSLRVQPASPGLEALATALRVGAPAGAAAAACAAVEFGWPRPGLRRHDLTAALVALVVGSLTAVAAALQIEYALGVLTGWTRILDFTAVPTARLTDVLSKGGLLSFVLAIGAASRRRGDSGVVGCGGLASVAIMGTSAALLVEVLATISSPQPPPRFSSRALELSIACVALAAVATLLCAVADAITGGWGDPPLEEARDAAA